MLLRGHGFGGITWIISILEMDGVFVASRSTLTDGWGGEQLDHVACKSAWLTIVDLANDIVQEHMYFRFETLLEFDIIYCCIQNILKENTTTDPCTTLQWNNPRMVRHTHGRVDPVDAGCTIP